MSEQPSPKRLHTASQSRWTTWLPNLVVLVIFVIGLFLPPISLGKRLFSDSFTSSDGQVWSATDPDGAELTILPAGLPDDARLTLELSSVPRADLLAGAAGKAYQPIVQALPSYLTIKSPLYEIRVRGATPTAALLRIPIPNDAEPWHTLDVYGWSGERWLRLDGRVRQEKEDILVRLDSLPEAAAVMQTQEMALVLSAPLPADQPLSEEQLGALAEIYPDGALVAEDGSILAAPSLSLPLPSGVRVMPTVRNWTETGKVWQGRVERIVNDEDLRQAHVNALRQFVAQGGYDGVDIDYRGLLTESRAAFSQFVADLAQELRRQGKLVSVRVSLPMAITPDQWDTGPYDWPALSRVADILRTPMPIDPRAYRPNGQAHTFLNWAVGEADRYKLQLVSVPLAVEQADDASATLSYVEALALLTRLETAGVPETVAPGEEIPLELPVLRRSSGLLYDQTLYTWGFTYLDERHHEHTIWLNNAEGLASRAEMAASYHLRGIAIEGLNQPGNDPNLWAAARALGGGADLPVAQRFSLQWQTDGPAGPSVVKASLVAGDAAYTWTAPAIEGLYEIAVVVTQDNQPVTTSEPLPVRVISSGAMGAPTSTSPPTSTPPATWTPTPSPIGTPSAASPTPTSPPTSTPPTASPTPTPPSTGTPPMATASATPTPTGGLSPTATSTSAAAPTITSTPTAVPTLLPAPLLALPESGTSFSETVRLTWAWFRTLEDFERFVVRWEPTEGPRVDDRWIGEEDTTVTPWEGGYVFEFDLDLSAYPEGEANWSVAIFGETPSQEWQISRWSERRLIYYGTPPV